jgi:hypothetical protein
VAVAAAQDGTRLKRLLDYTRTRDNNNNPSSFLFSFLLMSAVLTLAFVTTATAYADHQQQEKDSDKASEIKQKIGERLKSFLDNNNDKLPE